MQKLMARRSVSGLRNIHDASGKLLGNLDLGTLDLDDGELEEMATRHVQKARNQADIRSLLERLHGVANGAGGGVEPPALGSERSASAPIRLEGRLATNALCRRAHERARREGISDSQALSEEKAQDPALAQFYREEVTLEDQGVFAGRPNYHEMFKRVTARAEAQGITYAEALRQIREEDPALVSAAIHEGGMWIKDLKPVPGGARMIVCSDTELGAVRDPSGFIAMMAGNRQKAKKISYGLALSEIKRDYPRLAAAASRQVLCLGEWSRAAEN